MEPPASPSLSELYRPSIEGEHRDEEHRVLGECEAISGIGESVRVGVFFPKTPAASAMGECRNFRLTGASVASGVVEKRATKRKRGRPPGANVKTVRKKEDDGEDVCFICFDGGKLVLCDRRGCPKAYHPACIKRDEAFFRSRAQWNCGWHICIICKKASHYMCYTCTYAVCKACVRSSDILCVRSNMGFCAICMRTVMLMENCDQQAKQMVQVDFDDKSSWEYLFKVYWIYLKDKLSLTVDDLRKAWKPCGGVCSASSKGKLQTFDVAAGRDHYDVGNFSNAVYSSNKRKKVHKQPRVVGNAVKYGDGPVMYEATGWASQDVIEFVAFVKNGDTSPLSQFDVESLLLEYITRNNLRDPCIKNKFICDQRLRKLFGRSRMDDLEMLKQLEFHFPMKETPNSINGLHGVSGAVDPDGDTGKRDGQMIIHGDHQHTRHKKVNKNRGQSYFDAHATVDAHNIDLIYLRRSVMEILLEDVSEFSETVLGTIVRIRLSSNTQKQVYRLVKVVGVHKVAVPYKVGRRTTDFVLQVLNLDKKEIISIDSISDQLFSEEECWHFRQSIRCGLIKYLTAGEVQKNAKELRTVKMKDLVESDNLNLYHRTCRASEQGHKNNLGECIEKLDLLQASQELMHEIPEVHTDQTIDPGYDSEDDCKEQGGDGTLTSSSRSCNDSSAASHSRDCNTSTNYGIKVHKGSPFSGCGCIEYCSNDHVNGICSIAGSVPSAESNGIKKLWYYEDPHSRMQGPFSMVQLHKWSTTGYFPPDLRIWKDNERRDDSILLTDALNMLLHSRIHTQAEDENILFNEDNCCNELNTADSDPPIQDDCGNLALCGSKVVTTDAHRDCSPCWKGPDNAAYSTQSIREMHTERCDSVSEKEKKEAIGLAEITHQRQNEEVTSNCCSSSVQHWRPELTSISNSSTCLKLSVMSEPNSAIDFFNLPKPNPSDITENKLLDLRNVRTQDSNPSPSTVGSTTQPPDATAEWSGYSPTPAEPSPDEQGFSISSVSFMKPLNMANDHAPTPTSSIPQLNLTSLCWHAIGAEGSNFAPLAEESVSDLLAEADAMDSPKGLPSPSSILKDDCLDSIEVLSAFNGGKNDTMDSVCELRLFLRCTPNVMLEDLNNSGREAAGVAAIDLEGGTGAHKP